MHRAAARCQENFYPRPPRGGRRPPSRIWRWSWSFLSTPSARRATSLWETYLFAVVEFLSTPSARRATQSGRPDRDRCVISIHALREEGDVVDGDRPRDVSISIHALREEGDAQRGWNRATPRYFYPRPPRGGRLKQPVFSHNRRIISIHALREEGDRRRRCAASWA